MNLTNKLVFILLVVFCLNQFLDGVANLFVKPEIAAVHVNGHQYLTAKHGGFFGIVHDESCDGIH